MNEMERLRKYFPDDLQAEMDRHILSISESYEEGNDKEVRVKLRKFRESIDKRSYDEIR